MGQGGGPWGSLVERKSKRGVAHNLPPTWCFQYGIFKLGVGQHCAVPVPMPAKKPKSRFDPAEFGRIGSGSPTSASSPEFNPEARVGLRETLGTTTVSPGECPAVQAASNPEASGLVGRASPLLLATVRTHGLPTPVPSGARWIQTFASEPSCRPRVRAPKRRRIFQPPPSFLQLMNNKTPEAQTKPVSSSTMGLRAARCNMKKGAAALGKVGRRLMRVGFTPWAPMCCMAEDAWPHMHGGNQSASTHVGAGFAQLRHV